jgi:hypothetical protein
MNEKGTLIGCLNRKYILIPKEEKIISIRQDESREWISSLKYVYADGSAIDPLIIIKGIHFKEELFEHAILRITIVILEKG